jgi:ribosomal protein S18 acetylase RimI-like enzyme
MSSPGSHLPPIDLRPARLSDLDEIFQIEHLSFVHAGERFLPRRIRYLLGSPRAIVTVAEMEARVLGWAAGLMGPNRANRWGRVYAVAVHPESRGRKLGHRLLHAMVSDLRKRGAGRIFLEVRQDNHPAIKLYERSGFLPCKTLPNYYGHGIGAIRMSLDAAASA